jgi:hypothetical protein
MKLDKVTTLTVGEDALAEWRPLAVGDAENDELVGRY